MRIRDVAFRTAFVASLFAASDASIAATPGHAQEKFSIELRPDLVLGEATGVSFGGGLHVAVNSEGRIYVGDSMNRHVRVFSSDGELRQTLGRSGQGPGEFRAIHQVTVGRGDSLYVFDASARRVAVYAPGEEHTLAYTVTIGTLDGLGHPYRVFVPSDPTVGFLVAFIQQGPGTLRVHRMDGEGAVSPRVILEAKAREAVTKVGAGGTRVVRTSPLFGRTALLGMTPDDELFYGWSEAIDFTFYDVAGKWVGVYKADTQRLPVTDRDVKHELEGSSAMRRRALEGSEHPETKPALHTLLVYDNGWIWTGRLTEDPTVTQWWVHQRMTRINSAILELPEYVDLQVVRGGYTYAVSVDEVGYPTVVRYAVEAVGGREGGFGAWEAFCGSGAPTHCCAACSPAGLGPQPWTRT